VNRLQIRPLADCPGHADALANWHYAEWGSLFGPAWSREAALQELLDHAGRRGIPTTWVAEDEGAGLCGSVSVVLEDSPALQAMGSPWLASLYVRPEVRKAGIGRRLVQTAMAAAAAEGVDTLFLFTPHHAAFYAALGWRLLTAAEVNGNAVAVMAWSPREPVG